MDWPWRSAGSTAYHVPDIISSQPLSPHAAVGLTVACLPGYCEEETRCFSISTKVITVSDCASEKSRDLGDSPFLPEPPSFSL